MSEGWKSIGRQLVGFVVTLAVVVGVVRYTDLVRYVAYAVEKGRVEAMREALPTPKELAELESPARLVAATVAPAVVQVIAERHYDADDLAQLERLRSLLKPNGEDIGSNGNIASNGIVDISTNGEGGSNGIRAATEADLSPVPSEGITVPTGFGSGFIFDAQEGEGRILTNNHVIDGADSVAVHLSDGRRIAAEVVGADPKSDLAVLRIKADQLHELPIADSSTVEVGDEVFAVGNPFGLEGSFSRGIVSAKGRSSIDIHGIEYRGFIQTDAVINPGNSGGPLVNMRGEVIAINTAIATDSGHYDGVGFAIPSHRIIHLLPALEHGEPIKRGYLGVSIVSASDFLEECAGTGWSGQYGVIVRSVMDGTPAAKAELRVGDIILRVDEMKLRHAADLIDSIGDRPPGVSVNLALWRDGAEQSLKVELAQQPPNFTSRVRVPAATSD